MKRFDSPILAPHNARARCFCFLSGATEHQLICIYPGVPSVYHVKLYPGLGLFKVNHGSATMPCFEIIGKMQHHQEQPCQCNAKLTRPARG